jgi:predicted P-loop ATPase
VDHPRVDTDALLEDVDIVKVIDGYVALEKSGAEFQACCPFHTESTPSFKVSPSKQIYNCFGCGANGNAINFLMNYRGVGFLDACRELGADIPESGRATGVIKPPAAVRRESVKAKKDEPVWLPILPIPDVAPEPPKAHMFRGTPERTWCYRDGEGRALGYVYRFKTSDGGKETLPLSWCHLEGDESKRDWKWISFPQPRPLYGLDRLAAKPDTVVLVVEGEKCADAGDVERPDLAVVSWPGGGKAVDKVDWSPLAGRTVITWADCDGKRVPLNAEETEAIIDDGRLAGMPKGNEKSALVKELKKLKQDALVAAQAEKPLLPEADQPGVKTMAKVHGHLHKIGCTVWNIRIPLPLEKPDGWDIADAVEEGLTGDSLVTFMRERAVKVAPPAAVDAIPPEQLEAVYTPTDASAGPVYDVEADQNAWRQVLLYRDGLLVDCRENVYLFLKHHPRLKGVVWADEFARKIVVRKPAPWERPGAFEEGREWEPDDDFRLGLWLAQCERLLVRNEKNIARGVALCASDNRFHPVRDYLGALTWDGITRTRSWLTDYMGVKESEYTALVGHFFLIGMVARIYHPGCQMRFMPIFEGKQFRGKSSALRILGGQWYGDTVLDLNNKDCYQLIQGKWLYEIGELDAFNRAEATRIKAFVSSQTDRFRAPYDTVPRDWKRQGVFGGSTNQDEYFKDTTGNTRFWPLKTEEIEAINLEGLAEYRDQLFAEAVHLFQAGERWHPTSDEQKRLFDPEQADREIGDPWQPRITRWLRSSTALRVTTEDILVDCLKIEIGKADRGKQMSTAIGIAMKRIGWAKRREPDGDRLYYYERPADWVAVSPSVSSTPAVEEEGVYG